MCDGRARERKKVIKIKLIIKLNNHQPIKSFGTSQVDEPYIYNNVCQQKLKNKIYLDRFKHLAKRQLCLSVL